MAKLIEPDKDIAKEEKKYKRLRMKTVKIIWGLVLKNSKDERAASLEAASVGKKRTQINRLKETIDKVFKEDTTLGERLRTLFKNV